MIVQVGIVVRDALALVQAAREGARTAAITADDEETVDTVRRAAGPLEAERIEIAIAPAATERRRGEPVSVHLAYEERLRIPIVSRIVSLDLPLRASATMRLERSTPTPTPEPTPAPTSEPEPLPQSEPTPEPPEP